MTNSKPLHILILEDDPRQRVFLMGEFEREGHQVDTTATLAECRKAWDGNNYDTVVLDRQIKMGHREDDSLDLLIERRRAGDETNVLIMTAYKVSQENCVESLRLGAEYVRKPFDFPEVMARIEALIARQQGSRIVCGPVEIFIKARTVYLDDELVKLSDQEFNIVLYLAQHEGECVDYHFLMSDVAKNDYDKNLNRLSLAIYRIRGKFNKADPTVEVIKTVRNKGYIFQP